MAEEKVIILDVESASAAKSINDLKSNISTLEKALRTVDVGTEDWDKTVSALVANQARLKDINKQVSDALKEQVKDTAKVIEVETEKEKIEEKQLDTIKSLRSEISDYRDSLLNLEEGSQQYAETLSEIDTRQQRINEALNAGKEVVTKQTSAVRELQKDIKGYRDELLSLERGSEEYTKVINKIGEAQGRLNDINDDARIAALTLGEQLGNVIKLNSQITAGFSSIAALTNIFGNLGEESEVLNSVMVKLQASIALVQGLQGLTGLTKTFPLVTQSIKSLSSSLDGLKSTLISTGIGALAIGIGLLIANFDKLKNIINLTAQENETLSTSVKGYNSQIKETQTQNNLLISILQKQGAEEKEILTLKKESITAEIALTKAIISRFDSTKKLSSEEKKQLEDIKKSLEGQLQALANIESKQNELYIIEQARKLNNTKEANDAIELLRAQGVSEENLLKIRREALEQNIALNQAEIARLESLDFITTKEEEVLLIRKAALAELLSAQKKLQEDEQAAYLKGIQDRAKKAEQLKKQQEQQRKQDLKQIEEYNKSIQKYNLDSYDQQLFDLEDNYKKQYALLEKYGKDTTQLTDNFLSETRLILFNKTAEENNKAFEQTLNDSELAIADLYEKLAEAQLNYSEKQIGGITVFQGKEEIDNINNLIAEARAEQMLLNIEFLQEYKDSLEELLLDETIIGEQRLNIERDLQNTENDILKASSDYRIKLTENETAVKRQQEKAEKKILDDRIKQQQIYLNAYSGLLSAASSLIGQETAAGKAAAVASATVSTYAGAAQVLANPLQLSPFVKWANFATTIATGLAAVKNIVATKIPGGNDSVSTPSTSSIVPTVQTPTPVTPETFTPDIEERYTSLTSGEDNEVNNRVHVVETDIRDTINRVELKEENSDV